MKKYRFGVIGTNFVTDYVINASRQESRFMLSAVCSRTQQRADEFAAKYDIPHTFTSLEDMAASPDVDCVYIATPTALHAQQAMTCMRHGKHVLCEKPMASNAREAREMIEVAKQNDVLLMEAMIATLNPNFAVVRQTLPKIGAVRRYFASYCQYSSRYDKLKQGIIANAFRPELSNGAVMDIGIYTIYPMIVLFGKPLSVSAIGQKFFTGVDSQGAVNFKYDGMSATVMYSKIADSFLPTEIEGENGVIVVDQIHVPRQVTLMPPKRLMKTGAVKADISAPLDRNEYYYELREFIDLLEQGGRESSVNSHANTIATLEVIDEIRRQTGVEFPSDK
jgi:predicted dehydrogenase